ncbi:MAG: nucleoside hydrolase [Alphaproteobacteria bacterium]
MKQAQKMLKEERIETILFDCDPGLDDAVALLMAMAVPEKIRWLGITTAVGNTALSHIQENARKICELAGRLDIPVFAGCPRPLMSWTHYEEAAGAEVDENFSYVKKIHGDTGLGGGVLAAPQLPLQQEHAAFYIVRALREVLEPITLVATGALVNVAMALIIAPEVASKIERIILMGGSGSIGNITPASEYNFYVDPHAASIVFNAGIPIVMSNLDVTRKILAHADLLRRIRALGSSTACVIADIIESRPKGHYEPGMTEGVLHDATTIGYLLHPELFEAEEAFVYIETASGPNLGHSSIDWGGTTAPCNALVLKNVNVPAFEALMLDLLGRYSK